MKKIILFPHMLGQLKSGVQKTPMYIKPFIGKQYELHNIKCNNDLYKNLQDLYYVNMNINSPKINIGGDHSMSIATVADSLNKYPNLKLIWIDAHADINTYKKSSSKNYHGMPLSFLTGLDYDTRFNFINNLLPMNNILYIGIRDLDPFEKEIIEKHNIKYITVEDIRYNLLDNLNKISEFISSNPIHVSFDVDAMDPSIIYSTGTRVSNGFNINESHNILNYLNTKNIVNMDITELNCEIGNINQRFTSFTNFFKIFNNFIY